MALIKPFNAIRPALDKAHLVAALPYDVLNTEEARNEALDNPYSFLHVDKAEIDLPEGTDLYDDKVYEKAKDNLNKFISENVLIKEDKPCFYILQLTMNGRTQTGLVACTSIDEYISGKIKKHELTREDKEKDRIRHVDICNANTGLIFLAYKEEENIKGLIEEYKKENKSEYNFTADDGVEHVAWVVSDRAYIEKLTEYFKNVDSLYIADGHHRNASAVKVGLKRRQMNPNYTGEEEFNYYLSVLFPANELMIMPYNRVVKDLNGLSEEEFLEKLEENFKVVRIKGDKPYMPKRAHEFGMYLNDKWYFLDTRAKVIKPDSILVLDVSILQNEILAPILGIGDVRTDDRIDFVGGIRGLLELENMVDNGKAKVAFALYPTSIKELMFIADLGKNMPPKSTWFEPKLRSGLFIHSLE